MGLLGIVDIDYFVFAYYTEKSKYTKTRILKLIKGEGSKDFCYWPILGYISRYIHLFPYNF